VQRRAARFFAIALLVITGAAVPRASAAPCAGFTDVDDGSPFCENVQWIRNRGITLGCEGTALYCPNDAVSRLSMAAFMNRLGDALAPVRLGIAATGVNLDIDPAPRVCTTASHTVVGAPRLAHGLGTVAGAQGLETDLAVEIVESTDGGTSWSPVSPMHKVTSRESQSETISVMLPPRDLVVGANYRYALRLRRVPGSSTTGDAGQWGCALQVWLENRNPASPPLDVLR
jgi:hypothetical protein